MRFFSDTWFMTQRHFKAFVRQPMYLAFTLIQPVVWLFLFGQLFKQVTQLPGFGQGVGYVTYLAPAIVVMSALFGAGWGGMGILEDLGRVKKYRRARDACHARSRRWRSTHRCPI
jgi:ABC-2 type transport system permease protein